MPPHRQSNRLPPVSTRNQPEFIDLTDSPSTNMPQNRKRSASAASVDEVTDGATAGPSKRTRRAAPISLKTKASKKKTPAADVNADTNTIDHIDLVDENQSKVQEGPAEQAKPARLSSLTCVICLEPPTDLTATACGHLFCHHCLMEALIAGENRGERTKSNCPVCRKNISRKRKYDVIPLLLKKGRQPTRKVLRT
ncbi:hypothetical protein NA57DRAFT_71694 [Rhizodiscina lignyota]|uniref:RING-type domain-containing protein n=1 Tax=Rhizodiscina lignyota TaxID=1504668 RepID=A0A9P4IMK5_9PEZI|nr:hypothetical protein NA57DRAFT_71694 [Rhizodiscina lignyota]